MTDFEVVDPIGGLLGRIAAGEHDALARLYADTSADVLRVVSALVRDGHLAEEVAQEVYLQIWLTAAAAFDANVGSGHSFVVTLARRRAIDRIRSIQSARRRDAAWNEEHEARWDFTDLAVSRVQIESALQTLGERAQTIVAVYYQGQSYKEIAAQLGVSVTMVKNRHQRALVALRRLIQPVSDEPANVAS